MFSLHNNIEIPVIQLISVHNQKWNVNGKKIMEYINTVFWKADRLGTLEL